MSTQKRKDSSRANGAKSRGPVTPEGLARSSAARLTHGLTAAQILIGDDSEKKFNALRDEYFADYQPQNRSQFDLVDHLVATRWRLTRVIALQSALMDIQMARQKPEIDKEFIGCGGDIRAAIAYQHLCDDSRGLESLHRHEARLSAELRRTYRLLAAQPKNQKLHHEPSPAETKHSDQDRANRQAPPSTIDHPPSTGEEPQVTSPSVSPSVSRTAIPCDRILRTGSSIPDEPHPAAATRIVARPPKCRL